MPALSQPAPEESPLVLVSGASGYIAAHLCARLLINGYRVRGTVRSKEKGDWLKHLFSGVGAFEYVIVEDMTRTGAFDEAVKGVEAIAHTASPVDVDAKDAQKLIDTAVKGTEGIMQSALKNGSNVKRMVITSSVAAVRSEHPSGPRHQGGPPYTFTEEDWNEDSVATVEKEGTAAPGQEKYRASKTLAEKGAWDFMEKNKPSWDLATICPPLVLGPAIHDVPNPQHTESIAKFWAWFEGKKTEEDVGKSLGNYVDVRNVADAHIKALTTPEAGSNRYIVSAGPFCGQDIVDIIHCWPGLPFDNIPKGVKGQGAEINKQTNIMSGKKAADELGIRYIRLNITVEDMYKSLEEKFDESMSQAKRTD